MSDPDLLYKYSLSFSTGGKHLFDFLFKNYNAFTWMNLEFKYVTEIN